MPVKYKIIYPHMCYTAEVEQDEIVYQCMKPDYGLARDDSELTGIEHICVTLDPTGDYPFFTIPLEAIELLH